MVDAQAVDQPRADQLENLAMGGFEHRRALDTQAAQLIDVEEAPPVDVVRGGAPTGQAISLLFQQVMQALEALGLATVECGQALFNSG